MAAQFLPHVVAEQALSFAIVESAAPAKKTDLRSHVDALQKLLEFEIEAQIIMRHRQLRGDSPDGILNDLRQCFKSGGIPERLIGLVASEELIAAIAAQDDFNLLRRELRQ